MRGFRPLPQGWTIDWRLFLPIGGATPQPARKIDAHLADGLFDLPGVPGSEPQSLALRNLERGQVFDLPSGQDVARLLKAPRVFSGQELAAPEPTPLWFYILKEAELTPKAANDPATGGRQVGPVGARIVAEVILGLLRADPKSWINVGPTWEPTIPAADANQGLTLSDLVSFATT